MRILHTSDWHLGRSLEGRSRLPEQREFIDELCTLLDRENVDLILLAGDVFDTVNPSAEAEELFYEALERMASGGQRAVVVIAGNHDSPDRLHAANPLAHRHGIFLFGYPGEDLSGAEKGDTAQSATQPENVSTQTEEESAQSGNISAQTEVAATADTAVATADTAVPTEPAQDASRVRKITGGPGWIELSIPGCSQNAVVAALAYPSEQRLNEVLSASLEDEEMQQAYSSRVALAFEQAAANFRDDTVNLALSHLYILGGRNSESERDISIGGAYVVEPAAVPGKAHYVALGHLHRPQKVGGTPVPCRYSGSPLCYSFSEADQQKEVVLVDVDPASTTTITPIALTSGKPMRFLRFASYQEAHDWCADENNRNTWVDMEITAPAPLTGAETSELRKLHPGVINIRVILPGVETVAETGPRLSELSLEEKFRRFAARETGAEPEPELVAMLLELLDGGEDVEAC